MDLINKLGIDWKILLGQVINFAILAFVLYKFVYKTVLETLEKRTKLIEKGMHDAKESENRLLKIDATQKERMAQTEKQVGVLLERARKDAEVVKQGIVQAANLQAEDMIRRTKAQLAEEKEKILQEVKAETGALIIKLTAKLIEREFNSADQKRLADAVTSEMKSIL